MGRQSSRIYYKGKDHKEIYFRGRYCDAMYIGRNLVWWKNDTTNQDFGIQVFRLLISDYGDSLINEYGLKFIPNEEAYIEKAAVASFPIYNVNAYGESIKGVEIKLVGCVGKNITSITIEPYYAYDGEIVYTHENNEKIENYNMEYKEEIGFWMYGTALINYVGEMELTVGGNINLGRLPYYERKSAIKIDDNIKYENLRVFNRSIVEAQKWLSE